MCAKCLGHTRYSVRAMMIMNKVGWYLFFSICSDNDRAFTTCHFLVCPGLSGLHFHTGHKTCFRYDWVHSGLHRRFCLSIFLSGTNVICLLMGLMEEFLVLPSSRKY